MQLWLVVAAFTLHTVYASASTSSTLLRQTHRLLGRPTGRLTVQVAGVSPAAAAFVGRSAVARSGFRQFSQRATRLQGNLQKNFSFRAIAGDVTDVYTNNGSNSKSYKRQHKKHDCHSILASLTSMVTTAASEAISGFIGGYLLGAATGSARGSYFGIRNTFA